MTAATVTADERMATTSWAARVMRRPEVGAAVAALIIFVYFSVSTDAFLSTAGASTWLESSAQFGIMAVAVSLLMIGGEFDLSCGAMVGTTGLIVGVLATQLHTNIWVAVLASLVAAAMIGALNGWLVVKTKLPSFIVTLGTFFVLQGINLAGTKLVTGQVSIQGFSDVAGFYNARWVFGSSTQFGGFTLQISVVWWLMLTAAATWVLLRTRAGNWIFAIGGDADSARQVGVPVTRTKIGLFMTTALAAWLVGMLQLFKTSTVQASTGVGQEFIYIICAVVGGCLLTGGYGSAIGAALGALIYGMTLQGIVFAQWDNNWLKAFLGVMLLGAVLVNNWIRRHAEVRR
jgi:simple sugar transport system permease protein